MDHLIRVQRAVDFIEANLREEINMEQIAKAASFSMWHFQRIFSSSVGDSVKEYVRKRRLTLAMLELGTTDRRIRRFLQNVNHILLPQLWDHYMHRADAVKHRLGPEDLGVCEAVVDPKLKTHADECFYMAGTEVEKFEDIPVGMIGKTIPGGRYAVFIHKGKLDKLEQTMSYIYGSWLPKSGEELRDAPDLEVYGRRFKFGHDDSELEIHIPLK